jgi:hypothetical protein
LCIPGAHIEAKAMNENQGDALASRLEGEVPITQVAHLALHAIRDQAGAGSSVVGSRSASACFNSHRRKVTPARSVATENSRK